MKLNKKDYWEVKDEGKLKTSELLEACRKQFKVWSWYDDAKLDADFPPVKSTRYFKKDVEADEDLKNLSADDLKEKGIEGITLRERILLELQYFKDTGKHLDIDNITLCSGSRYSDGLVPDVRLASGGNVRVGWYDSRGSRPYLRARRAVVPSSLTSELVKKEGYKIYKEI